MPSLKAGALVASVISVCVGVLLLIGLEQGWLADAAGGTSVSAGNRLADSDGDGLSDLLDNCVDAANPDQRDTDGDQYGNACDPDLNNDLIVNLVDLVQFKARFFTSDPDADFNGDGTVNLTDLIVLRSGFFEAPGPSGTAAAETSIALTRVYAGVPVASPLALRQRPGESSVMYVLERAGRVLGFAAEDNVSEHHVVLDISSRVDPFFEGGALGFDFDPQFASNGYLYVSYTGSSGFGQLVSRVSRFTATEEANGNFLADPASELIMFSLVQPFANHNGGNLLFGPDGYLYFGLGDGGSGGDPLDNGQNPGTLLATMMRLDVRVSEADIDSGVTYRIPPDNPFVNGGCSAALRAPCPEVFAYGLRNPWRFSFDRETGELWVGDVGQTGFEEIDIVSAGGNYGWRCREGNATYDNSGCAASGFEPPLHVYGRSLGISVTGGYVYRGANAAFRGMYVFGDYGSGRIWGLFGDEYAGQLLASGMPVVSFGEALDGELYVLTFSPSAIWRIDFLP